MGSLAMHRTIRKKTGECAECRSHAAERRLEVITDQVKVRNLIVPGRPDLGECVRGRGAYRRQAGTQAADGRGLYESTAATPRGTELFTEMPKLLRRRPLSLAGLTQRQCAPRHAEALSRRAKFPRAPGCPNSWRILRSNRAFMMLPSAERATWETEAAAEPTDARAGYGPSTKTGAACVSIAMPAACSDAKSASVGTRR
jgi:hypothetical protein